MKGKFRIITEGYERSFPVFTLWGILSPKDDNCSLMRGDVKKQEVIIMAKERICGIYCIENLGIGLSGVISRFYNTVFSAEQSPWAFF